MGDGRGSKKELGLWNWNSARLSTASFFMWGARFPSPQSPCLRGGPAVVRPREESGRWCPFRGPPTHVGPLEMSAATAAALR